MADPEQITKLVSTHSVFTEDAPPSLTGKLRERLQSIAQKNEGQVPVHGRLFAQWMHHAFPSTCPFPHVAGTTNPQTPDEWIEQAGTARATKEEMKKVSEAWE